MGTKGCRMKAMILAAGRGERMLTLSEATPKPLLKIRGHRLIEHRIFALKKAGIHEIVINLFYLGKQIADYLGDGTRYGVTITYSWEKEKLDVGGGIIHALPLLGGKPFLLTSADIDTDFPYETLKLPASSLAHLVLTDNPDHHPEGDFYLHDHLISFEPSDDKLTYMNIALFDPALFASFEEGQRSFLDCLKPAIAHHQISAEYYDGYWLNIDTPARLELANVKKQLTPHPCEDGSPKKE